MRTVVNLHILQREFTQLAESTYFDEGFREFSTRTLSAINHVLANLALYPEQLIKLFELHLWNARTFVKGSRANDTPYEVQFALKIALRQWTSETALISSSKEENLNFFLNQLDLWTFITKSLQNFDTQGYKPRVVRIGSPGVYKHRPVFCIPLFHELGHYIDIAYSVSKLTMITSPHPGGGSGQLLQVIENHRMEHFADLFAACYCAESLNDILSYLAGGQGATLTHPAIDARIQVVSDFLAGNANSIVDMFQQVLPMRGLPQLANKYTIPDISSSFDDVRTFQINSDEEMFGLFPAAWRYLEQQLDNQSAPWAQGMTMLAVESLVNDMVEKSLRNYEIRVRWRNVAGA